jgi:hypothetical protein
MAPTVSIDKLPGLGDRKVFGRSLETAWLDRCWKEGAGVASIIAPGGVGKSALVWDWQGRRWAAAAGPRRPWASLPARASILNGGPAGAWILAP